MCYLAGCSKNVRSQSDVNWEQNNALSDSEIQVDRPPTAKTLWAIADIQAKQGRDRECAIVLRRIIQEYPEFLPAYNLLAEVQMRQGNTKGAVKTLQDGLNLKPTSPVLLNNLGMCYILLKDYETALEAFTRAAGLMPENRKYRANMAVALGLLGRDEEALSLFKQILPESQAQQNLVVLQNKRKQDLSNPALSPQSLDWQEYWSRLTDDDTAQANASTDPTERDTGTPLPK